MNSPRPALVTQRAAQRLPRPLLLLFCAAWVVPGVFGREPWRNADLASYGVMAAMAEGRTSWWSPTLGGLPVQAEPLPHWLGAAAIWLLGPTLGGPLAARLPFAIVLALALACVWYASYHLARTEAARPVAFAFGGEASTLDYARAIADGSVLAMIATLGLLQLGHETTPELVQLLGAGLTLWALAAAPYRPRSAPAGLVLGLSMLAASGAPAIAVTLGLLGIPICRRSAYPAARALVIWCVAGALVAALLAVVSKTWAWRWTFEPSGTQVLQIARQWLWFMWPAGPFALWTLWQWRHQGLNRHVSVPLALVLTALATSVAMGGNDRALMLALPGLSVLAAFALPTFKRSLAAAIDWFSVFFFSLCAAFAWLTYVAMHTGHPARWAANITKLQPGFEPRFSALALAVGLAGTVAWLALVRWRTGRQQHALWKSLVLPASGVALCWLLLMSLWLPLLDHARSARPLIERVAQPLALANCVAAPDAPPAMVAALEVYARKTVFAGAAGKPDQSACNTLARFQREAAPASVAGWQVVTSARRNRDDSDLLTIYRRQPISAP